MKKIVVINYTGRHGSGNVHAIVMAKELINLGESVVAIVSEESDNLSDWQSLKLERLIILKTYNSKVQFLFRTIRFFVLGNDEIKKLRNEYDIKGVYCPMCTYWTYIVNRILGTDNIVICKHDPDPHDGKKEFFLSALAYKNSKKIIVHSKKFVEYVKMQYPKKEICYMPLTSLNIYGTGNKVDEYYNKYDMNFIFFGVINDYKGIDILGEAFKIAVEKNERISLTVAANGDFSKYENIYTDLKNCRIINRWIDDKEIPSLFSSDKLVTILPYKDATQSGVVLVAKQYTSPIIATRTGGLDEQICHMKTGLIIEPNNIKQLSESIINISNNKLLFAEMKNNIINELSLVNDAALAKELIDLF